MAKPRKLRSEIAHPRPCREAAIANSLQAIQPGGPVDWTPPLSLRGKALAEWHHIVAHLEEYQIGRAADRTAVEAACRLWAVFSEALDQVERKGLGTKPTTGTRSQTSSPIRVAFDAIAQLRQLWGALGMTPDSRYRIRAATESDKSKIVSDWLYGSEPERPLKKNEDY